MKQTKGTSQYLGLLIGAAVIVTGGYFFYKPSAQTNHAPTVAMALSESDVSAKASEKSVSQSFSDQQKQEIQDLFLKFIKDKPEIVIGAINEAMQLQQEKAKTEMVKIVNDNKDKLLAAGISLGDPKATVNLIAFVDPLCHFCHEFEKVTLAILKKRQDVNIRLLPVPLLAPNSLLISKFMIASANQGTDKFKSFLNKLLEGIDNKIDQVGLVKLAKDAGLDTQKLEKDVDSEEIDKLIKSNATLADQIKIPGVPSVFGFNDKESIVVQPMDLDSFNKFLDDFKAGKTSEEEVPTAVETNKNEPAAEANKDKPAVDTKKNESATDVKKDKPTTDAKKDESAADKKAEPTKK